MLKDIDYLFIPKTSLRNFSSVSLSEILECLALLSEPTVTGIVFERLKPSSVAVSLNVSLISAPLITGLAELFLVTAKLFVK